MLPSGTSYEEIAGRFAWQVPARYNIGIDVCDKWAARDPGRLALIELEASGAAREVSFGELKELSDRFANLLAGLGVAPGARVGLLLSQRLETALAHIAIYKLGAIAVPLFTLFGAEALAFRLADSGAMAVFTDLAGAAKLAEIRDGLPALAQVLTVDGAAPGTVDLQAALSRASSDFTPRETAAEDPALIIYTSGTTGPPKGALHAHRVLLGHLPGVEMSHDGFPSSGDRIWTPADWAWIGGLLDVLLPAWHHGIAVVARRFEKFDPEAAFALIAEQQVRNVFLPPTALKMMRQVPAAALPQGLALRSLASGGESLGGELLAWGREVFGLTINEFYGQTECNMIVSSAARLGVSRGGAMGRPVPGHRLAVVDKDGKPLPAGEQGEIAVQRPDPVMFLGYWNNPEASAAKFVGDWMMTGDCALADAEGYLHFVGRADDVITSGGYRIGPGEVEDCLLGHPAVANAAVVGLPDPLRGQIVAAFVVLEPGQEGSPELTEALQAHVRSRLAAHEYPRRIFYRDDLPLTATGKIRRRDLRALAAGAEGAPQ